MSSSKTQGKVFSYVMFLTFLLIATLIIWALRDVAFMLVLSYIVAYIVDPALDFLQRKKISRPLGVVCIMAGVVTVGVLSIVIVAPYLAHEVMELKDKVPDILSFTKSHFVDFKSFLLSRFPQVKFFDFSTDKIFSYITGENIQRLLGTVANTLLAGYSYTLTIINAFFFPVFAYYCSVDFDKINLLCLKAIPTQYQAGLKSLFCDIDKSISSYLRGQLLVCFLMAVLYAIGLSIVGVDLWLLIAVFSGFANLVPYLGVTLGIVFAFLMAIVSGGGWGMILGVIIVFIIVSFLESLFITPKIQGKNMGISPLVIMLALIAGAKLMGIFGMLIAIPTLSALKVLFNHYYFSSLNGVFSKK